MAPVIIYPAIDLKNGECVRLVRGDMAQATVFNEDPAAQARIFARQGFTHLHVVDLDGAFAGKPMNVQAVERILAAVAMPASRGPSSAPRRSATRISYAKPPASIPVGSR
jgi:phosphoribosylformimino-5-aminoimidazole carboxamide ribotide isomerase